MNEMGLKFINIRGGGFLLHRQNAILKALIFTSDTPEVLCH